MVATRNLEFRKGHRLDRHRLLKEPVEQLPPVPRRPAIKTEGNLPHRRHTTHWAWLTQVDTPQRANELRPTGCWTTKRRPEVDRRFSNF